MAFLFAYIDMKLQALCSLLTTANHNKREREKEREMDDAAVNDLDSP